jgi:hypothetical protein
MQYTTPQIKNLMRRGLRLLVDPEPTREEKTRIRDYFQHRCAYCGKALPTDQGDIDHLIPAALGGANGLANRVLSCKPCNAHEKRDRNWLEFIQAKSESLTVFQERRAKIENWVAANGGHAALDDDILAVVTEEARRATAEYERACARIRTVAANPFRHTASHCSPFSAYAVTPVADTGSHTEPPVEPLSGFFD